MAGRVTLDTIEVLGVPDDAVVRVTADTVEVLGVPDDAVVRVTAHVVEVMVASPTYTTDSARSWGYIIG